ncbi:TonB-dependent receptor [Acetobacter nitrogenifigens]|uniref:TonB-dependent receptor n=1 Tax=Acetobacter nitrogenifigens DSM 23921 = NBRC 105050 TaxID=1120919 RepID=A0A511XCG2_9PROT|nr:TonB-dependent receptor [Acetobacter nitrogenifigens DSM 23921 = NBRC 105050]
MASVLSRLLATSMLVVVAAPVSLAYGASTAAVGGTTVRHDAGRRSTEDRPSMMGATAPTDTAQEERVTVQGSRHSQIAAGLMIKEDAPKSRSTVTQAFIAHQNPASNPMQLISLLPGVNTTSLDPLGLSSGYMSMRGLTQDQVGYTLEGFPLNDIGNYAIYPQEITDAENLRTINVEQGSADLDSPHISATGGAVDMYLLNPKEKFGGTVDASYGSYNSRRIFGRVDTGRVGNSNVKGFVSFSYAAEDSWRGPGGQNKMHGETKWVDEWGKGNVISFTLVGNHATSTLFPSTHMSDWNAKGIHNAYSGTWDPKNPSSDYYELHRNPFTNIYASAPSTFTLSDHIKLTETPYFWYGDGNGGGAYSENLQNFQWGTQSYTGSVGSYNASNVDQAFGNTGKNKGNILLYNPSNTQTYRPGAVTKVTITTGVNRLMLGYWFEYSKQFQTGPYSLINYATGKPLDMLGGGQNLVLSNGDTAQYRDTLTQTRIHTLFIADSLSLLNNRLNIEAGLKYTFVGRQGHNFLPDTSTGPYINQSWQEPLPAASIRYKINAENQLFASVTTNFRIPMNVSLYDSGAYYKGSGYSTHANPNMRPEVSISEELGWRYQGPLVMSSLTYFHYNFTNRLYSQTVQLPGGNYYSRSFNGGGMHADGLDFEIGTRPIFYHIRPYFSAEYVHAITDSNIAASGGITDYVRSKGKYAPQTPAYQFGFNLSYDDGHLFGDYSLKYVARQYSTFNNDQHIPSYVLMNIDVGYHFPDMGRFKSPTIRLNLQNIANNHYLGYASGVQANATSVKGVFGSTLKGSAPTYGIAAPFAALATASVDF